MSKNKQPIFSPSDCLSLDLIVKYLDEQLTMQQMHRVEKHMLECELCKEAIEGYALMEQKDKAAGIIFELNKAFRGKNEGVWDIRRMAAGIAAVLILGGGLVYLNLNLNKEGSVAVQLPKESDSLKESGNFLSPEKKLEEKTIAIENPLRKKESKTPDEKPSPVVAPKGSFSDGYMLGPSEEVLYESGKEEVSKTNENKVQAKPIAKDTEYPEKEDEMKADKFAGTSVGETKDLRTKSNVSTGNVSEISPRKYKTEGKKRSKAAYYDKAPSDSKTPDAKISAEGMAELDDSRNDIDEGIQKYRQKEYAAANITFEKILQEDSSNTKAMYYNGLSYMEAGKPGLAIENFNRVKKGKEFYEAAQWNKALALVKKGDKAGAQLIFKELSTNDGPYKQKALEELKKLE